MSSPSPLTQDLARRIKQRREHLMLSQIEAAQVLDVSARTLQAWEAGTAFPQPRHRRAITGFLDEATS